MIRRLARPLLASMFVAGGVDVLRDPEPRAKTAEPVLAKVREISPVPFPDDDVAVVRADAMVKVGAGILLALGRAQRLSAMALAASLVLTTLAAHRFWEVQDPAQRANQRVHFAKNLGLLGGLLFAVEDTGGRPSVGYRTRKAARRAQRALPGQ